MVDLPPDGGPSNSSKRRPTSETRGGRLEIVDDASERLIDAEQFTFEELPRFEGVAGRRCTAMPEKHVPDIFRGWCATSAIGLTGTTLVRKISERSLPALARDAVC